MKHVYDLFASLPWTTLRPAGEAGPNSSAQGGGVVLPYILPDAPARSSGGGSGTAEWFDPRTGKRTPAEVKDGVATVPDKGDWVLVETRTK